MRHDVDGVFQSVFSHSSDGSVKTANASKFETATSSLFEQFQRDLIAEHERLAAERERQLRLESAALRLEIADLRMRLGCSGSGVIALAGAIWAKESATGNEADAEWPEQAETRAASPAANAPASSQSTAYPSPDVHASSQRAKNVDGKTKVWSGASAALFGEAESLSGQVLIVRSSGDDKPGIGSKYSRAKEITIDSEMLRDLPNVERPQAETEPVTKAPIALAAERVDAHQSEVQLADVQYPSVDAELADTTLAPDASNAEEPDEAPVEAENELRASVSSRRAEGLFASSDVEVGMKPELPVCTGAEDMAAGSVPGHLLGSEDAHRAAEPVRCPASPDASIASLVKSPAREAASLPAEAGACCQSPYRAPVPEQLMSRAAEQERSGAYGALLPAAEQGCPSTSSALVPATAPEPGCSSTCDAAAPELSTPASAACSELELVSPSPVGSRESRTPELPCPTASWRCSSPARGTGPGTPGYAGRPSVVQALRRARNASHRERQCSSSLSQRGGQGASSVALS
mmetsp:Transcript_41710/g.90915  ORF Transcript_41710/g.90915 Transcript_41710/m.90915 type:complete len:522 (-) Transcript_41710:68-1633(-)